LRVSSQAPKPAPAAAVAATHTWEILQQTLFSTQPLGLQDIRNEGMPDMQEKLPTRQQIERRACEIYLKRGGQSGNDMADWLAAEKELTSHNQRKAPEPSPLAILLMLRGRRHPGSGSRRDAQ
jgi:hypothetical protein